MPVPATTGQLQENVLDMEIADYIVMKVTSTGLHEFGGTTAGYTETPVNGTKQSLLNTFIYMVKVDKGLLIADRVRSHSVSWDSLNVQKAIEGNTWNSANLIPVMTSNTSPSGIVSASSVSSNQNGAFQAFDGKLVGAWKNVWYTNGESTGWLAYEFPEPKIVRKYTVICGDATDTPASSPKDWIFEGWDGDKWDQLDYVYGQTNWSGSQKRHFLIENNTPYRKYRINVFSNNGSAFLSIGELEMFEFTGIMRSLTGGVTNADGNGHLSLIDKNQGGWPTNNEWDKYIVNFPIDKIQPGKSLDDVFHWKVGVATWCQETPVNGTRHHDGVTAGASIHRIWRGSANVSGSVRQEVNYSNFSGSSISSTTIGYRPVFEYREK
ncbi:hypothetical protein FB479_106192 [Brevibacillus sp. AG162]|uniref:hypothetical protein n=1 Tax=Brevibacillus sp. AG162 TaxID=2572910 RepID=UPI001151F3D9|nr:hypothetical protein [Brevibacillus sp. AG162]TQK62109.1 hypothetical protein FB479_106192 [Brevibacillus sp. AG162]